MVKIYGDTSGNPGTLLATMTNPGTITEEAVNVFTALANTTLSASTTYWVVTSNSAATNGTGFQVNTVTNTNLDSGTAAGWSIGNARFKSDIADASWGISSGRISFQILGTSGTTTNNPPTVANAIPDQAATAGTAFSYAFPANTFSDADTGDTLSYTATKADDTVLPTWLDFAASTRTFSGTPQAADAGTVSVKVTASDGNGGSVSDEFDITVAADPNAHCNALDTSELWCGTLTVGVSRGVAYGYNAVLSFGSVAPLTFTHGGATITVNRLLYAGIRFQFGMSSALGAGDFSLEIGTGGAKRSFAMNNPGIEADFFNHGLSWSANETVPVKLLLVNTPATGAPTITGTAQVGQTLTATVGDIADVDGLPDPFLTDANTSFQWIRVATDNSETDIGAMAGAYTLVADDQGTTIKVKVSFTGNNGFAETRTSAATAAVSAAANTPATGAPTITGTAQVGQTLTAGTTAIMDADGLTTPSYTYQWIRVATDNSETNIASATASTYTLVAADLGTTVKVRVSFTDDASNDETLTSNVSVIIARPANTAATGKPGITGTAQVGQTLTATVGTSADVDGLPNPFLTDVNTSFQWIRVATDNTETNIASATASTYTLVDADLGTTIKVKVGFADYYDYDETLTSDATAAVAASTNTPATGAPTITGTAQVGQTLTAGTTAIMDADGLTSVSYTYQWIRTAAGVDTNISGATASTYTLVAADLGTTVKVRVSFTDDASNDETLTSNVSVIIARPANTAATGKPGITGTAQVGQTLTATVGTSADVDGLPNPFLTDVNTSFQWIRVATDNTETNISSATASTYTLVAADQGTTVKVRVSFTDDASNAETLTSAATAAVSANNPPTSSNKNLALNEDTELTFFASDFTFTDADGNSLSSVKILSLPATDKGTLTFSGMALTSGGPAADGACGPIQQPEIRPPGERKRGRDPLYEFHLQGERRHGRQCGNVYTIPHRVPCERRGDGPARDHGHGAGRADAGGDGGHHCGCGRIAGPLSDGHQHQLPVGPGDKRDRRRHFGCERQYLHAGGRRRGQEDQGESLVHGHRSYHQPDRGPADQRGDGDRLGVDQHPRDGRADDHRHGAGRADADGGHHRHRGCRRADQRQLHVPVDPGGHRQH